MYKVTFPLHLVTFPGCIMTFTQATVLESKLVFLKKYRVGTDETRSQWSGGQAQFDRLLFNALSGKQTSFDQLNINYTQPMSSITNFYWLRFCWQLCNQKFPQWKQEVQYLQSSCSDQARLMRPWE